MNQQSDIPRHRLGIDLGGTKIEAVVLNELLHPVYRKRMDTPAEDYDRVLQSIVELVHQAETELEIKTRIGIGTPGAISPRSGLLRNSNTVCLNGKPFIADIQECLQRPVKIQNDANCFALSEALTGAGKNYSVVFGVILGTGTGGGLVINQTLLTGLHAISGEWGHNPLPWHKETDGSPPCYCGKSGCIETFVSGTGLEGEYQRRHAEALSSRQIVQGAREGVETCVQAMERYFDQLARALAHVVNIIDPDVIVLGGGMSNIEEIYRQLPNRLGDYAFSDYFATPIIPARHGDASGVLGAAML
ncbi:MAG: ROK family protein [Proteobacteria bacterium]|nr:ROK family protein [Pseudomonadota bacterium]